MPTALTKTGSGSEADTFVEQPQNVLFTFESVESPGETDIGGSPTNTNRSGNFYRLKMCSYNFVLLVFSWLSLAFLDNNPKVLVQFLLKLTATGTLELLRQCNHTLVRGLRSYK